MYVDTSIARSNGKTYTRHLLRTSFREQGKVKHKTIANLSDCSDQEVAAIKLALKHKKDLSVLGSAKDIRTVLGKRFGAAWALTVLAERLHLREVLGNDRDGKLALLQIIARTLGQGSRLSAVRLAKSHALCEVLGLAKLDEDDLYENLAWLSGEQERIEKKLFALRFPETKPMLFLYDVTSSYLEGTDNELADWGYNRDGKRGKMQIVVGLLVGPDGLPVAVRVFRGNTNDTKTVSEQVSILASNFDVHEVTLVGDRGMIKGPQIDALPDGFRYITAITKPQIAKMLSAGILQMDLFDKVVCEVQQGSVRYVLRRNPVRAEQMAQSRLARAEVIASFAKTRTEHLEKHPRAQPDAALKKVIHKIERLKLGKWLTATLQDRTVRVEHDGDALAEAALLDGCYVIKSDVPEVSASAQQLHDRYCDLESVERSFRTMKTTHLEMRPIFVRKEASTKGHVFVVMLALLLQRELEKCCRNLDLTVDEVIDELSAIPLQTLYIADKPPIHRIPEPSEIGQKILELAGVLMPTILPVRTASVHTKKKLHSERKVA